MTALIGALWFAVLGVWCIGLPGFLLTRRSIASARPIELVAYTIGLGATTVSFTGYAIGMLTHTFLSTLLFAAVALGVSGVSLLLPKSPSVGASSATPGPARGGLRTAWGPPLIACGVVGLFFLFVYDDELTRLTCIHYRVARSLGIQMGSGPDWTRNEVLSLRWTGRGGPPMQTSLFLTLFQYVGFRFGYSFFHSSVVLFGYLFTRGIGATRAPAIVAATALALLAPVGAIGEIDQNVMSLAIALMAFALSLRDAAPSALIGFLFGIVFDIEHVMLPAIVGFLVLEAGRPKPLRAVGWFLAGFAIPAGVEAIYHQVAFGSPFHYEAVEVWGHYFPGVEPVKFTHRLGPLRFELETLLNYPFGQRVVRSPYNPLPMFLLFPIDLLEQFGVLAAGLAVVGYGLLVRRRPRVAAALLTFCLPYFLILQFQENWTDLLKRRLVIVFMVAPLAGFAIGLGSLVERSRRWRTILAGVAVAGCLATFVHTAARIQVPVDERQYLSSPNLKRETTAELTAVAKSTARARWLPSLDALFGVPARIAASSKAIPRQLGAARFDQQPIPFVEWFEQIIAQRWWDHFFHPRFRDVDGNRVGTWRPRVSTPRTPSPAWHWTGPLVVDLGRDLVGSDGWLRPRAPEDQTIARLATPPLDGIETYSNIRVSWTPNPIDVVLVHTVYGAHQMLLLTVIVRDRGEYPEDPRPLPGDLLEFEPVEGVPLHAGYSIYYMPSTSWSWDTELVDGRLTLGEPVRD